MPRGTRDRGGPAPCRVENGLCITCGDSVLWDARVPASLARRQSLCMRAALGPSPPLCPCSQEVYRDTTRSRLSALFPGLPGQLSAPTPGRWPSGSSLRDTEAPTFNSVSLTVASTTTSRTVPTSSTSITCVVTVTVTADLRGELAVPRAVRQASFCTRFLAPSLRPYLRGYVISPVLLMRKQRPRAAADLPVTASERAPGHLDPQTAEPSLLVSMLLCLR